MTREDIIEFVKQAGFETTTRTHVIDGPKQIFFGDASVIQKFIALVAEVEREACKQIAKEQAAQYKVGGALQMAMEKYSAQTAASACGHIAHLIEQRGSK